MKTIELKNYDLASEIEQSKFIFEQYSKFKTKPGNFEDINERFVFAFPKIDFFLSIESITTNTSIPDLINTYFTGRLNHYLKSCYSLGYVGRFGATVDPSNYTLNFEASSISLLWIPKNSCTTLKMVFLSNEPVEKTAFILKRKLHQSCKKHFGVNRIQIMKGDVLPTVCVLREPITRIISCYLDKFAKPILDNKPFERFSIDHVVAAQRILGIDPDLQRSITFSEFIDYILSSPRWAFNSHWRPQRDFIPMDRDNIHFGQVENLNKFFESLHISYSSKNYNKSFGGGLNYCTTGDLANRLPSELTNETITDYGRFLTDQNQGRLQRILGEDFSLYQEFTDNQPRLRTSTNTNIRTE